MFAPPKSVPVEQLLLHGAAYLRAHPNDPEAMYRVGRIRYLAFAFGAEHLPVYGKVDDENVPDIEQRVTNAWSYQFKEALEKRAEELARWEMKIGKNESLTQKQAEALGPVMAKHVSKIEAEGWLPSKMPPAVRIQHASSALLAFTEAIRLNRDAGNAPNALFHLGRASLMEEFRKWNTAKHPSGVTPALSAVTDSHVLADYYHAHTAAFAQESKHKNKPAFIPFTGTEAGAGYIRVADKVGAKLTDQEKQWLVEVRGGVAKLEALSDMGFITPIILALKPVQGIGDLLDADRRVRFDLRGYGPKAEWPWVKPDAGFLVWDPERIGDITSARQMFGSYTWQIFWRDGYEALGVLDEDGDGKMTVRELDGLAVWFDRNGNGISDPGEVIPVKDLGIVSIRTSATTTDRGNPANPRGLTMHDGRELPTWDWITRPAPKTRLHPSPTPP